MSVDVTINISFLSLFFYFVPLYLYLKKLDIIKSHFQISIISSFRKNDSNFASRKILNEADRIGRFEKNFQLPPFIPCSFHFVNDSDKRGREGDVACYRRYRRNKHYSQAPRGEGGFEVIMAVRYFAPSVFYRLFIDNNILGSWLEYRAKFSTRRKKECFEARMTS